MKTKSIATLAALTIFIFFSSCEKEIQLDLDDNKSTLVIEAEIVSGTAVNTVKLTKTLSFSEGNNFPLVSGAMVHLKDNAGYSENLVEVNPGEYQTQFFNGLVGNTYYLTVTYDDKTYTAESKIEPATVLDTVIAKKVNIGGTEAISLLPIFMDASGRVNYYRFITFINDKRVKGSDVTSDEFTDGQINTIPFFKSNINPLNGDSIRLEMQAISNEAYLYFTSKSQAANQQSSAPANPVTNIRGGALGYFSAHTAHSKSTFFYN